ncbi:MAG TPA: hypothetical protein DFS52_04140 [Myxococcales bacterium]|jgi:hypothetical protein|nr:hypothetical protein [Myxococcales bacterium]
MKLMRMKKRHEFLERRIEKTPVTPWVVAAALSIPLSLTLFARGKKLGGLLVGLWTPTLLNASIYNRLLKTGA